MHTTDKAEGDFVKGTDFPELAQQIGYYRSNSAAQASYTAGIRILNNCRDISFTSDGHKITGSIGQLSLPRFGQQSSAYQLVLSAEGIKIGIEAVVVREAAELEVLLYGDLGTPDLGEFTSLTRKAIAKMPAS